MGRINVNHVKRLLEANPDLFVYKQNVKSYKDDLNVAHTGWGVVSIAGEQPSTGCHLNL